MATGLFDPPRNCPYGARDLHSLDCVRERAYVGLLKSFLLGYVLYEITQVQPTVFTPGFLLLFFFFPAPSTLISAFFSRFIQIFVCVFFRILFYFLFLRSLFLLVLYCCF